MDDVMEHRPTDGASGTAVSARPSRTRRPAKGRAKRADAQKKRPRGASRAKLAAKAGRPGLSVYAKRLLLLARWAVPRGGEALTHAEIDRLTAWTVGQTHAFIGRTQNPHVDTLFAYARLFGVHPAWFITGFGPRPHVRAIRAAVARARAAHALDEEKAAFVAERMRAVAEELKPLTREDLDRLRETASAALRPRS